MVDNGVLDKVTKPTIRCKAFKDNSGALELANTPKIRPRTKHINTKYHHFCEHVKSKAIKILSISSEEQQADIMTKPLSEELFLKLQKLLLGW